MADQLAILLQGLLSRDIYDLEQPRTMDMPSPPQRLAYSYALTRRHRDNYAPNKTGPRSSATGNIIMTDHSGTHIDAIAHQAADLHLYGGVEVTPQVETTNGFTVHGIHTMAPIIARGVLLDVCRSKGQDPLPLHYRITARDLEVAQRENGVTILAGDVLLVRTGYGQLWSDATRYLAAAGISREGTEWVSSHNVKCVGSDNRAWDELEDQDPETGGNEFAHLFLIAQRGIAIMENLNLEELSRDRRTEFIFVCAPLKFVGATGSPVRPLAIA